MSALHHRTTIDSARLTDRGVILLTAALAVTWSAWQGLAVGAWGDWVAEARPSVDLLLAGHVSGFLRAAPAYGGSLLLRAPFMIVAHLCHGTAAEVYRAGAVPCLAALAGVALWLAHRMARRGCGLPARAVTVALCIANPLTIPALQLGHPEELLGASLCVAAVLCAEDERPWWAGALVGLAIANKSWGVLAAGPVLVCLPRGRGRAVGAMVVCAGAVLVPFMLVRSGGAVGQAAAAGAGSGGLFSPFQLWWFLGAHVNSPSGPLRLAPSWLNGVGHTLLIAVMPPLTLVLAARRRLAGARRGDALLLLALLLAIRCALDPWDTAYYTVPFLTALLAWETTARDRPPVASLAAAAITWLVMQQSPLILGDRRDVLAFVFAAAAVTALGALAVVLFGWADAPTRGWRTRTSRATRSASSPA